MADSKPDLAAERFNNVASEWDEKPSTLSCTIKMAEAIKAKWLLVVIFSVSTLCCRLWYPIALYEVH